MQKFNKRSIAAAAVLIVSGLAMAESVHQSVPANKLYTGDGGNAVSKGQMETKQVEGADGGQVARIKGDMKQWGFVNCWFGLPAPEGKSVARLRIYVDSQKTAKFMLYIRTKDEQTSIGELKIPADAKEGTFVNVDVPVDSKTEWSGLVIKKADTSDLPSPWIDTASIVLAD
jgi:hypothetical protein